MLIIWKYDVPLDREWELRLPTPGRILTVQTQFGQPRLWAVVDPDTSAPNVTRRLYLGLTGHEIPESARYLGTFQLDDGGFVGHLFEVDGL